MAYAGMTRNGAQREHYGVILTFENAAGKRLVLHRTGKRVQVVRELCAAACELDASFRVLTVCTPDTIADDLRGRMPYKSADGDWRRLPTPEAALLAAAGLTRMLA